MELVVILLCSMSGALMGTAMGILLMFRKIRQPSAEAQLAKLKEKLQGTEASLAARTADCENLRKQLTERDLTIQSNDEAVREIQRHLDVAVAERSATDQRVRELDIQIEALNEQRTELQAKLKEAKDLGAEAVNQQVTSYEAELDTERRQVRQLTEQVARLTAEAAEIRGSHEQETLERSSLETTLGAEQERVRQLTAQVQELQSERSQFDARLQEERQSAAKGMEMLLKAQESFARVFKSGGVDAQNGGNGSNGHTSIEAAAAMAETTAQGAAELQPVLALD